MSIEKVVASSERAHAEDRPAGGVSRLLQDPLGSVVAASAATIGSFGVVVGGIWAISLAVG